MAGQANVGTILIGMRAGTGAFEKDLARANASLNKFAAQARGLNLKDAVLGGLVGGGSFKVADLAVDAIRAIPNAIGNAVQTAADLESQFVGLSKATDLEGAELEKLSDELRALSVNLRGVKLDDLLAIATTGAKLGIARRDLVAYTEGIAKLSVTIDDIPATQLAEEVGKINVVFKLGAEGATQLGSAIDKVADSGASSAAGIIDFTQRVSGTASSAGIAAPELIALGGAILDSGVEAEKASTVMIELIQGLNNVKKQGAFAEALGVSVEDFAKMVKENASGALFEFLRAVQKLDAAGQQAALGGILGESASSQIGVAQNLVQNLQAAEEYAKATNVQFKTLAQLNSSYSKEAKSRNAAQTQFNNQLQLLGESAGNAFGPLLDAGRSFVGLLAKIGAEGFKRITPYAEMFGQAVSLAFDIAGAALDQIAEAVRFLEEGFSKTISWAEKLSGIDLPGGAEFGVAKGNFDPGKIANAKKGVEDAGKAAELAAKKFTTFGDAMGAAFGGVGSIGLQNHMQAVRDGVKALSDELRLQAAAVGKTSTEMEIYKLQLGGASQAEISELKALAKNVQAMEKADAAMKKRADDAKELAESLKTPADQLTDELAKLSNLRRGGDISFETYAKGVRSARSKFEQGGGIGAGGALEMGSQEARSAILAFRQTSRKEPIQDVAKNTATTAQAVQRQTNVLENLPAKIGAEIGKFIGERIDL